MEANEQDREGLKISCGISCGSLVEGYKIDQERERKRRPRKDSLKIH